MPGDYHVLAVLLQGTNDEGLRYPAFPVGMNRQPAGRTMRATLPVVA